MGGAGTFDYPIGWRSGLITLNGHRSAAGALIPGAAEADTYRVERFDPSRVQIRDQREPLHLLMGGDLGDATKAFRYIGISGMCIASSAAKLDDRIAALLAAFDIDACQLASPSTEGIHALTFYSPTEAVGYAPVVQEQYLCRPAGFPAVPVRRSQGWSVPYAIELVAADPRRYLAAQTLVTLNSGNGFSATCPNWTAAMGMAVAPVIAVTMSGAGHASFSFDFAGDTPGALVLNLSGLVNGNVVTIDCATGRILVGSTDRADLRTSGVLTALPFIVAGGAVATATNTTGVSKVEITYRQARG